MSLGGARMSDRTGSIQPLGVSLEVVPGVLLSCAQMLTIAHGELSDNTAKVTMRH